jgi:hypothetical protein
MTSHVSCSYVNVYVFIYEKSIKNSILTVTIPYHNNIVNKLKLTRINQLKEYIYI